MENKTDWSDWLACFALGLVVAGDGWVSVIFMGIAAIFLFVMSRIIKSSLQ